MARTHEVPNHLNVQDTLFLGLTARQVATFMAFASPAYGIWDELTVAPVPIRGTLAGLIVLAGIAFTLIQPGGRQLDEWYLPCSPTLSRRSDCAGVGPRLIHKSGVRARRPDGSTSHHDSAGETSRSSQVIWEKYRDQ